MITVNLDAHGFGDMMIMCLRYALGRRTYATGEVADLIINNKQFISSRVRTVMIRDLERYFEDRKCGKQCDDKCDYQTWIRLYSFLERGDKNE